MRLGVGGLLVLLGAPLAPSVPPLVPIEVRLAVHGSLRGLATAEVTLRPLGGEQHGEPLTKRIGGRDLGGGTRFAVPSDSTWRVTVDLPGAWSRAQIVRVGSGEAKPVVLSIYPAGELIGSVRVPSGLQPPGELKVRFRSAPAAAETLEEVADTCQITSGRFRCLLPAARLDLRLRAQGFQSRYLWAADIPAGGRRDAGTLELKPGASIVGWIESPGKDFRCEQTEVDLEPLGSSPSTFPDEPTRRAALHQKERANSRGFFELAGLVPGLYAVTVRHPGFAQARLSPVQVLPRAETELSPIRLRPPAALELRLEPPLDPYGHRWVVELSKQDLNHEHYELVTKAAADGEGRWRAPGLEAGSYLAQTEGSLRSKWGEVSIDVYPGMAPVEVRLPLVEVDGAIGLGGEPLAALLWFGGLHGDRQIAVRSGRDGKFSIFLPDQPIWRVEVFNRSMDLWASVRDVVIHKAPGAGRGRVAIELADTAVRGTVVDEAGNAFPGARLEVFRDGYDNTDIASDAAGKFAVRGLAPGIWSFEAKARDLSSESVAVDVRERSSGPDLRIVLRKRVKLSGMVAEPSGGAVAGAQIVAMFPGLGSLTSFMPQASTDVTGVFTLNLPAGVDSVQLTVFAPGFAVRQLVVAAQSQEPLVIPVSQEAGTLVLRFPEEGADDAGRVQRTSIFHEFPLASAFHLESWAVLNGAPPSNGRRFVVPMLEPGHYTACYDVSLTPYLTPGTSPDEPKCVSGDLAANGELALDVPMGSPPVVKADAPSRPRP